VLTLAKHGYLYQPEKRGKYSLGTIYMDFNAVLKRKLRMRDVAVPHLISLNEKFKESVILGEWNKNSGLLIEIYHGSGFSNSPLRVVPDEGSAIPLHSTCSGKIVLADMSDEQLNKYFSVNLEKYTRKTIVDIDLMKVHIIKIKKEYHIGVKGVSAGVYDNLDKLIGTISIVAPSIRFSRAVVKEVVPEVKACALKISQLMGYKP
jgi:DNA-binding IclR family transcriptional regulator